MIMSKIYRSVFYSILYLILAAGSGLAQASRNINVRLPVTVRAGDSILEPGPYRMELENSADGKILVHIRRGDDAKILASRVASYQTSNIKAERNAVKVLFRDGSYYLDKLQIMGETGVLIFQP